MASYGLTLHEVSKRFDKVIALDSASLAVRPGSIHALLGENGAGKTTLMRIAFGMIRPDSGTIRMNDEPVSFSSPADAIAAGIGMVHQQFSLIPEMTIAENVALGGTGRYDNQETAKRVAALAAKMGMTINPLSKVRDLTASERQKVEIIRTFAHHARTLILDEPTAVLTPRDIGDLFGQLRAFATNGGSVVLITHKLHDALEHADEVTVLRRGRAVLNAPTSDATQSTLASAMLGQIQVGIPTGRRQAGLPQTPVLELRSVSIRDRRGIQQLSHVFFEIKRGEVVGVAALEGAARSLLRVMAGRIEPTTGEIVRPASIGFVPEDRSQDAVIPEFSLTENFALRNSSRRSGRIDWSVVRQQTEEVIEEFDVRTPSTEVRMNSLSGGNQQKFILGRELANHPDLLILENPTQGLDVHATAAIHDKIRSASRFGTAIVYYSSDLDELAALSDRVIVVADGSIAETGPDLSLIGEVLLSTTST
ncbi:MAG: ATP-binding cassette domain-containing protein [Gemmatimonadales bacterium]